MVMWRSVANWCYCAQCRKREQVLEELCCFAPVHEHRSQFATQLFWRQALTSLATLLVLIACILEMLGVQWYGLHVDLQEELRQSLVDNDFDEEHNVFTDIAKWEDWWNFAHHSLAPFLTATQAYQGLSYAGDVRVSPVLLRQVRTKTDDEGLLPAWDRGLLNAMEEKAPLKTATCVQGQHNASARDGCVWMQPPGSATISAYTHGNMHRFYPASGYVVELTKDNIEEELEALQLDAWLDAATRYVAVEAMAYSKSRNRVAYMKLGVEVSPSGWHSPLVSIVTWKPVRFGVEHVVYLFLFAQRLGEEALHLLRLGPKPYFASLGNILNLFLAVLVFSIFVCQILIIEGGVNYDALDPWTPAHGQFSMFYDVISTVQVQNVCAALSLLLSILKFLSHCVSLPVFGPIGTKSTLQQFILRANCIPSLPVPPLRVLLPSFVTIEPARTYPGYLVGYLVLTCALFCHGLAPQTVLGIFELLRQPIIPFFLLCYLWMLIGFAFCFFILAVRPCVYVGCSLARIISSRLLSVLLG